MTLDVFEQVQDAFVLVGLHRISLVMAALVFFRVVAENFNCDSIIASTNKRALWLIFCDGHRLVVDFQLAVLSPYQRVLQPVGVIALREIFA